MFFFLSLKGIFSLFSGKMFLNKEWKKKTAEGVFESLQPATIVENSFQTITEIIKKDIKKILDKCSELRNSIPKRQAIKPYVIPFLKRVYKSEANLYAYISLKVALLSI